MAQPHFTKRNLRIRSADIDAKVKAIAAKYDPDRIVLFGSFAKGNPGPDSDVDLLIIMETKRSTLDLAAEISLSVKHNFPMDIIVRTPQEIDRRLSQGDFFISGIIQNGRVLYERNR